MRALAGTVFSVALLVPPAAAVAEAPSTAAGTQLVHVDVAVTDKKGQPVLGLTAGDFEVFDDGAPVRIDNFQPPEAAETGRVTSPDRDPAPAAGRRPSVSTLTVYVDNGNLSAGNRNQMLDGVARLIEERLREGTRVLLVADRQGLKALTGLTTDAREIAAALEGLRREPAEGNVSAAQERSAVGDLRDVISMLALGGSSCEDGLDALLDIAKQHATRRSIHVARTLSRLATLVQALGALPGQKALLYVSEGFEQRPGIHFFYHVGDLCPAALTRDLWRVLGPRQEHDASRSLEELSVLANAHRVTLYTFDVSGVFENRAASVELQGRSWTPSMQADSVHIANSRDSQRILAEGTGGLWGFRSRGPNGFLARLSRDLSAHYAVGFTPAHEPDGLVHRIGVRLKGPAGRSWTVRHRESYRHTTPGEGPGERTLAALVLGMVHNPLGVAVAAGEPGTGEEGGRRQVPLRISLPALGTQARGVRLLVAIRDAKGETSVEESTVLREKRFEVPASAAQELVVNTKLEAGEHDVAVGVYDEATATGSYLRLHVSVPQRSAGVGAR